MNKLSSKFGFPAIFVALVLTLMVPFCIYMSANSPAAGLLLPVIFLIIPIYFWLTEFRTRAHRVTIEDNQITKKEYFGFGGLTTYRYGDFEGFITSQQPGKLGPKEFIFLIIEGRRIICISEFYHRNYFQLKKAINKKVLYLGEKEYRFEYEYKQMFR